MERARRRTSACRRGRAERWALAGLLHDLDYAETGEDPDRHGLVTRRAARRRGRRRDPPRDPRARATRRRASRSWTRRCTRPIRRPGSSSRRRWCGRTSDLAGVELRSLLKRWKEKAFARGASREQMATCAKTRPDARGVPGAITGSHAGARGRARPVAATSRSTGIRHARYFMCAARPTRRREEHSGAPHRRDTRGRQAKTDKVYTHAGLHVPPRRRGLGEHRPQGPHHGGRLPRGRFRATVRTGRPRPQGPHLRRVRAFEG